MKLNAFGTPEPVAEAVVDALFSENPKPRYLVGGNEEETIGVVEKIMSTLNQINQGHEHSLSRQGLIEILGRYFDDEREQS